MKVNPFRNNIVSAVLLQDSGATSVAAWMKLKMYQQLLILMQPYQIHSYRISANLVKNNRWYSSCHYSYLEQEEKLLLKQILL